MNPLQLVRKIRACETETAAQLVLEHALAARPEAGEAKELLAAVLAHKFAEECQECAIGKSEPWRLAKQYMNKGSE